MPRHPTFAVVGAGLAGGTAAATLREEGFEGRLVLIGDEELPPYERPPLSKEYLRGEQTLDAGFLRSPGWYEAHGIEARFGERVERLDPRERVIRVAGGDDVSFDVALIATGSRNRRLRIPGGDLPGVVDLRTALDARLIRRLASAADRALVVGMGFTGAEVAASLRVRGLDVTVVETFATPLYRALGPRIGALYEEVHREHGVRMLFGDSVERYEGAGRLESAITRSGHRIEADLAIEAIGSVPTVDAAPDLANREGRIDVDARLETNVPGILAAGDIAAHAHPLFGRISVEHFDSALKMGAAAAGNMLGRGEVFDDPHWFWSDQFDVNLEVAGSVDRWDDLVIRGATSDRRFAVFYLEAGVLRGALTVNDPRTARRSLPLIALRARPDPKALAEPGVDLRSLVSEEEAGGEG